MSGKADGAFGTERVFHPDTYTPTLSNFRSRSQFSLNVDSLPRRSVSDNESCHVPSIDEAGIDLVAEVLADGTGPDCYICYL